MLSFNPIQNALKMCVRKQIASEKTDIYQSVARRLLSDSTKQRANAIGLTSASSGEGVTTVATRLAMSAAKTAGRPVLLVDCNREHPGVEQAFGLTASSGLCDALSGRKELAECLRSTKIPNLAVLGLGGKMRGNDIAQWEGSLAEITDAFALVLLDMPSAGEVIAQPIPLDTLDGMLLVVEAERTRRKAVVRAKSQLERVQAEVLGVILNKRKKHVPDWLYELI
ncbi:MAG: CpsD/CapB family tyrosine-protein kinase [Planctomycetes bacterium]|nr:CpsD/CapB family tyrosine-protein kinase [Planctomycetota bacterium]